MDQANLFRHFFQNCSNHAQISEELKNHFELTFHQSSSFFGWHLSFLIFSKLKTFRFGKIPKTENLAVIGAVLCFIM